MNIEILPNFYSFMQLIWLILSNGGWIIVVLFAIYILYTLYLDEIQGQYKQSVAWTLLELKPPKENPTSLYNAEQVFIQLHQLLDNWSFQDKYVEGKTMLTVSFEIVSMGGKISYLARVPTKQRGLLEASLYANFPNLEITEIEDYLKNFDFDPESSEYDLFGTEYELVKNQCFPIRSYREFEGLTGPEVSNLIVDPLSGLLEVFTSISSSEFYGVQFIIEPVMDDSWHKEVDKIVEDLRGTKTVVKPDGKVDKVINDFMGLDDIVKEQIKAVKNKIGRPAFKTKIRFIQIANKEHFNKDAKKMLLSPFRTFSSANFNGFKPAFSPKKDFKISPGLEAAYIDYWVKNRKKELFNAYKNRSNWVGVNKFILNTEELATIFHFPVSKTPISQPVESLDSKKLQAPANLPV